MEAQGARVTSFEVGYDAVIHMVPPVKTSARLVHGDLYQLPQDLGGFDINVFGPILLHLRDPFRALPQAAAHTTERIVVVEALPYGLEGDVPLLHFGTPPQHQNPIFTGGSIPRA